MTETARMSAAGRRGARIIALPAHPDDDRARALAAITQEHGRLEALRVETQQAIDAGNEVLGCLCSARACLSSANTWANIDVFGAGGFLTDLAKRRRMDDASAHLRAAEVALQRFGRELADVDAAIDGLQLNLALTVMDIAFDNFFADLMVKNRISPAGRQAAWAQRVVSQKVAELTDYLLTLQARGQRLEERRIALLNR